jgi:hypothetical protein
MRRRPTHSVPINARRISIDDALIGARLLTRLPAFLRNPIGVKEARAALRRRLERREVDFLALVRRSIYEYAESPYRPLLRHAGCAYGDLQRLVGREGVEGALRALYRAGVYLTVNEFKGRRPVVRGTTQIAVQTTRLRNPYAASGAFGATSASRGSGTSVPIDLAFLAERAVNTCLFLDARGANGWEHAIWEVPGSSMVTLLRYARCGTPPMHWFSQVDPDAPELHPRYRWSARAMCTFSHLIGVPLPSPRHVSLDDPRPVIDWMVGTIRRGATPHLDTFVSPALRLCIAAHAAGIDLSGVQLTVTGEPFTAARLAVIRRAGADAVPSYRSAEAGAIGFGCLAPEVSDEVHQYHDLLAVIEADLPRTLLLSSLRPTAPMVMLNVSLGDQAVLSRRACGCPLERLGWTTHLHTIQSFEKLTAGGMTFLDTDVVRVLEEVLPARFGGAPTHYQLLEEHGDVGQPPLRLLVDPSVGPLALDAVAETFLAAVGVGSGAERVMGLAWRDARLLRVERRPPLATPSGKILHLHAGAPR